MSKQSRVAWRVREQELQAELEQTGSDVDTPECNQAYKNLSDHYNSRTIGDKIGGFYDWLRG